jgi:peptidoglycan/LPS O-acetylase OafA/YrhL
MTEPAAPRIPALDGIRALAVLAVLAFHAHLRWAPGGFLGVDTFFVLSGFVITRTMLDEHSRRGTLDLARFWSRRLARLLPALLLVVAVVAAFAAGRDGSMRAAFRADAVSALLYVSNWRFLAQGSGYFAATAEPSLLQHTWSLAVEEQFYLAWPMAVALALRARRPRATLLVAAAGGAVASAILQIGLSLSGASATRLYFGSDVRAQSLLIGATVAVLLPARTRLAAPGAPRLAVEVLGLLGVAGTGLLWARADGSSPWLYHGGMTTAAIATAAVIAATVLLPSGVVATVCNVAPLRWLGRISYGVYLWHWPVQLLVTRAATGWHGGPLLVLRFALTVAIAAASYNLLEVPVRMRSRPPLPRIASFAAVSLALASVIAITGAPDVLRDPSAEASAHAEAVAPTSPSASATLAPPEGTTTTAPADVPAPTPPPTTPLTTPPTTAPPLRPLYRVAILGDSVAQSLARGLAPLQRPYGLSVFDDGILGCGVVPSGPYHLAGTENGVADECAAWEQIWTDRVRRDRPDVAVLQLGRHEVLDRELNGVWTNILDPAFAAYVGEQVEHSLDVAARSGSRVVVLTAPFYRTSERPDGGQWPENDPARVRRLNEILRTVVARHPAVTLVDLGLHTNPSGRFTATVDGVRMRRDGVHYSAEGCAWFAPWLVPQVRQAAALRGS